jgi:hypothetical protein
MQHCDKDVVMLCCVRVCRERGYVTLFTYVTTTTKGVYAAIAKRVPRQYRPQVRPWGRQIAIAAFMP